jgi:hypothetical protein
MVDRPPEVEPIYTTDKPNAPVSLSCEDVELVLTDGSSFSAKADICFKFLPKPELHIEMDDSGIPFQKLLSDEPHQAIFPSRGCSATVMLKRLDGTTLTVIPDNDPMKVLDRGTSALSHVVFHVVNFHEFYSKSPDVAVEPSGRQTRIDKVSLPADGWRVVISLVKNTRSNIRSFHHDLGYAITHVGKIERDNGDPFSLHDAEKMLHGIHYFLSFARGMWVAPILPVGFDASGARVWEMWGRRNVDSWETVRSWFDGMRSDVLSSAFPGFWQRWCDSRWHDAIRGGIYWYILGNKSSRGLDTGMVLTQAALELLSYVYVVEEKAMKTKKEFKSLRACDKLLLALNDMGIPAAIPAQLTEITRLAGKKSVQWTDGAQAFTEIRNDIVHAKRRFKGEPPDILWEGWNLGLWYLELTLLKLCQHDGVYANRLKMNRSAGEVETVPWAP